LDAVINGSVAAMPAALRGSAEARLDARTRARLKALMTTWSDGGNMDRAEFAGQFFGRAVDDPVAMGLRTAALTARLSGRQDALRDAAEHLAGAMRTVGLDRLPRFLDDAEVRANQPSTRAALEKSRQTLVQRDAIRPVYPLETALGVAAAGVAGGVVGVARAAVGVIVRQLLPKSSNIAGRAPVPPSLTKFQPTRDVVAPGGRPVGAVAGRTNGNFRTVSPAEFTTIKDKLLQRATPVKKPRYDGTWYQRPDGSAFGIRTSQKNGVTIDVSDPNLPPNFKVHQK
jgi:hypothetical protein